MTKPDIHNIPTVEKEDSHGSIAFPKSALLAVDIQSLYFPGRAWFDILALDVPQ